MLHVHLSGQTQLIILGFLWRVSDSSSGESQHFQTCSKPWRLHQACSSYLSTFLTLNDLHGPGKPVNIYVSIYVRGRLAEHWSNVAFIYDLPLTLTQAGGNQTSSWVFATEMSTASYMWTHASPTPRVAPPILKALEFLMIRYSAFYKKRGIGQVWMDVVLHLSSFCCSLAMKYLHIIFPTKSCSASHMMPASSVSWELTVTS